MLIVLILLKLGKPEMVPLPPIEMLENELVTSVPPE